MLTDRMLTDRMLTDRMLTELANSRDVLDDVIHAASENIRLREARARGAEGLPWVWRAGR